MALLEAVMDCGFGNWWVTRRGFVSRVSGWSAPWFIIHKWLKNDTCVNIILATLFIWCVFFPSAGRMLHIRCALKPKKNARITTWRILSIIRFSLQRCSAYGKQKTLSLRKERSLSGVSIRTISFLYCCFFVRADGEKEDTVSLRLCCFYRFGAKKKKR